MNVIIGFKKGKLFGILTDEITVSPRSANRGMKGTYLCFRKMTGLVISQKIGVQFRRDPCQWSKYFWVCKGGFFEEILRYSPLVCKALAC